jgi:hypothetical protein
MAAMSNVRNFALLDKEGNEYGVFDEKQNLQSAFKATNPCKKANPNRDYPVQGTWDKKGHIFKT